MSMNNNLAIKASLAKALAFITGARQSKYIRGRLVSLETHRARLAKKKVRRKMAKRSRRINRRKAK